MLGPELLYTEDLLAMCLALEYACGDTHICMKSEDKGEDRMRTTGLRAYPHEQTVTFIIHAVRVRNCPNSAQLPRITTPQ